MTLFRRISALALTLVLVLAMTAGIRRVMSEKPEVFDPRTYLSVARTEVRAMVKHKIENVLGSANTL